MEKPTLYLVPTPIGNLKDITLRALDILGLVDLIVCEDTRQTRKLLSHFGIKKSLISYERFSEARKMESILEQLQSGKNIAMVSDAGTPAISDPGSRLITKVRERGIRIAEDEHIKRCYYLLRVTEEITWNPEIDLKIHTQKANMCC
jgi:16S rRNA (cytidine1402-2'-O)-methyltransferase